jgi:hypothetical protein
MLQKDDIIIKLDGIATGHLNAMPGTPSPLLGHCGSTVSLQILRVSELLLFVPPSPLFVPLFFCSFPFVCSFPVSYRHPSLTTCIVRLAAVDAARIFN